jgi:hypothetical protein
MITWRELGGYDAGVATAAASTLLHFYNNNNNRTAKCNTFQAHTYTITITKSTLFINKNAKCMRQILHCSYFIVANSEPLDWDSRLL